MKLSVIIVNYNVEYFLEQCLSSALEASKNLDVEIMVVDNNSIDGSMEMVEAKFPQVHLIKNKENTGFSKANNQGMKIAKGQYVLLLNPDTVVEEDTFEKIVAFMDEHPDAGGLGVKMIDGKGNFLPESKRGLPTPTVAFYKIFGISRLMPKSKKVGRYHLSYLDKDEINEVEILSGAFMLMRKEALDKVGLLDEAFFMYGEDIDLSYRIIKGGYKNYYFPETRIIHYKGESTKKSSVNYVFVFYNAMIIFAKKHFSQKNARLFSLLINIAIYFRAGMAVTSRIIKGSIVPLLDATTAIFALFVLTHYYQEWMNLIYKPEILNVALPSYGALWLVMTFFSGGYDKPMKVLNILKGLAIGTAIILMIYALLPKSVQFSRMIIILGTMTTMLSIMTMRLGLNLARIKGYSFSARENKRYAIVGNPDEASRVTDLLNQTTRKIESIDLISPDKNKHAGYKGDISQIDQILHIHKIDEVIFCAKDNTARQIIEVMSAFANKKVEFKIAQPESLYLIGSNSIDTSGDLFVLDINSITKPQNRRNKRLFDMATSIWLTITAPVSLWFMVHKLGFLRNLFSVMIGSKSWVGFAYTDQQSAIKLPPISSGVLSPTSIIKGNISAEKVEKLNIIYAKDYRVSTDVKILFKAFRNLGS